MSDERRAVNIKRDDYAVPGREVPDFIARNPNIVGCADIFNLDFGTPIIRVGMLASVLTGLFDEERRPAVRRWVVIADTISPA
ncbi:hypothetical protein [Acidiphilium acidophilum]|uniref:Uncharacterized protein n=1 Tax=Acidiphilium acidophilum TaxID=76588 RepID=A0AAW9DLN6_ACIAO|nr:hypothetical protein [Acidiphilium acidophilum]MDX5929811.1 hypothetical protein [Acidiphilium acidophilum]